MTDSLTTSWVARTMRAFGYEVTEGPERSVIGGAADSRKVRPGDLFTAFPGENTDGNLFVEAALAAGAIAVVCSRRPTAAIGEATIVVAPDATRAIGQLAHAWRLACNPRLAGITGTVGKTTTKDLTASVLSTAFATHKSEGLLNSREGLPLALMSLRPEQTHSVLEMGMDSIGEILELCAIAEPEVGAVLNIGLTHVSKVGSPEAIVVEKLSLARYLAPSGTAVLNIDDPRISPVIGELRCRVITFGSCELATLRRGPIENLGLDGTSFAVTFEGRNVTVRSPLPGTHLAPAALAAMGVGLAFGMPLDETAEAVGGAERIGRLVRRPGLNGSTILDDRYNSSPASLAGALDLLRGMSGRRIALLGKMAELGAFEVGEHETAGRIAARSCDLLVSFGETTRPLIEAARASGLPDARWFATKEEAARAIRPLLARADFVLVKGSRSEALETVIPLLEGAS